MKAKASVFRTSPTRWQKRIYSVPRGAVSFSCGLSWMNSMWCPGAPEARNLLWPRSFLRRRALPITAVARLIRTLPHARKLRPKNQGRKIEAGKFRNTLMPSLYSTTRETGSIILVDLSGRIALGEGSALLRKTVRDILDSGHVTPTLTLGDVNSIDSSGIG